MNYSPRKYNCKKKKKKKKNKEKNKETYSVISNPQRLICHYDITKKIFSHLCIAKPKTQAIS